MNFLAHLYLSVGDEEIRFGNFIGDFVKGRIGHDYPDKIRSGLVLHRRIDSFAQYHPLFRMSIDRLSPHYGLYRAVMVDLFYDHFLAARWEEWGDEPLDALLFSTRTKVEELNAYIPVAMRGFATVLLDELIPSYRKVEGIGRALDRMSRRVRRENPLSGSEKELVRCYGGLQDDFRVFLPDARRFVAEVIP